MSVVLNKPVVGVSGMNSSVYWTACRHGRHPFFEK